MFEISSPEPAHIRLPRLCCRNANPSWRSPRPLHPWGHLHLGKVSCNESRSPEKQWILVFSREFPHGTSKRGCLILLKKGGRDSSIAKREPCISRFSNIRSKQYRFLKPKTCRRMGLQSYPHSTQLTRSAAWPQDFGDADESTPQRENASWSALRRSSPMP